MIMWCYAYFQGTQFPAYPISQLKREGIWQFPGGNNTIQYNTLQLYCSADQKQAGVSGNDVWEVGNRNREHSWNSGTGREWKNIPIIWEQESEALIFGNEREREILLTPKNRFHPNYGVKTPLSARISTRWGKISTDRFSKFSTFCISFSMVFGYHSFKKR